MYCTVIANEMFPQYSMMLLIVYLSLMLLIVYLPLMIDILGLKCSTISLILSHFVLDPRQTPTNFVM